VYGAAQAQSTVHAILDRVQVVARARLGEKPPLKLNGFKIRFNGYVSRQTTTKTYAKCCIYHSRTDEAKIYWQYDRQAPWLEPWKISIVPDDDKGTTLDLLRSVTRHCRSWRFLTVELAIDFKRSTKVNGRFIRKHAIFGKSRPQIKGKNSPR
jgi:hypothetical protein